VKRPEGFDPTPPPAAKKPTKPVKPLKPAVAPRPTSAPPRASTTVPTQPAGKPAPRIRGGAPKPDAAAKGDLRRAARERRRFERAEVRRFTRRARNRRVAIAAVGGVILTLVLLVITAVYSPLLALRTVAVDGTSRIDPAEIVAAADDQLGTPLALIDYDRMTRDLSVFPLIRSYVTEIVPPDTILIHVTERQPVGSISSTSGFDLIDPAGIVVQQSAERIPGVPLIDLGGDSVTSPTFAAVVEVLLALPPELLAQVDSISARSQDDVSLVLAGVGQAVQWGSADQSERKATLLAALIRVTDPASPGTFDVSAPGNGVFRPS